MDQLLLKVEQLPLEAWVRIDAGASGLDIAHRLEQRPIILLHEVGDDTSGRPRLACITITRSNVNNIFNDRVDYLPVNEYGAAGLDRVFDEPDGAGYLLHYVLPRNVHYADDFVFNF